MSNSIAQNAAEVSIQPRELFVLWAVKKKFCRTTQDFKTHYGDSFPIDEIVGDLRTQDFVKKLSNETQRIQLTEKGQFAIGEHVDKHSECNLIRPFYWVSSVVSATASFMALKLLTSQWKTLGADTDLLNIGFLVCAILFAASFWFLAIRQKDSAPRFDKCRDIAWIVSGFSLGYCLRDYFAADEKTQFLNGALFYVVVNLLFALFWNLHGKQQDGKQQVGFVDKVRNGLKWCDTWWIIYFVPIIFGFWGVRAAYENEKNYWMSTWSEYGYWGETAMLAFCAVLTVWTRRILFPVDRNQEYASAPPPNSASKLPRRKWQRRQRNPDSEETAQSASVPLPDKLIPRQVEAFLIGFGMMFVFWLIYLFKTVHDYRFPPLFWYYWAFYLFVCFYFAWNFEILIAIFQTYTSKRLEEIVEGCHQLDDLADRLRNDTTDLIWSMGTIIFFVLVYFGNYYLGITYIILSTCSLLILFIAIWPWRQAYKHANKLFTAQTADLKTDLRKAKNARYSYESKKWKTAAVADYEAAQNELQCFDNIMAKFEFLPWITARSKDVIPVTLLALFAPYLGIPILDQIVRFLHPK